jgi:hypothetical protein
MDRSSAGAREMALRVRSLAGQKGTASGPVSLKVILSLARATVREADLRAADGGREALLLPVERDRFEIVVDPTPRGGWQDHEPPLQRSVAQTRKRFRIAHEIGHTFFYVRDGGRPRRLCPPGTKEEEAFCDAFAEELLVSDAAILENPPTAAHVFRVARMLGVSVEVTARALARRHPSQPRVSLFYWRKRGLEKAHATLQWTNSYLEAPPPPWNPGSFDSQSRQLLLIET